MEDGGMTALFLAVLYGKEDIVEYLVEKGADVNAKTYGVTALCFAKTKKIVECLVSHDADVDGTA
jgi:ankyrin repeat protein